ncbi:MAG TPA: CPBP family intramembrane glutamic endopeptidase [Longimicrobiales bacterium]|nr:CPBP family intramembrane glutamic endopeptidase [Longimicrobiales bacterium]
MSVFLVAFGMPRSAAGLASVLLVAALAAAYLGASVALVRRRARALCPEGPAAALPWTALLWAAVMAYAWATGLFSPGRGIVYASYLLAPALVLAPTGRRWREARTLAAAAVLWLPLELRLLPSLPVGSPRGYDALKLVALVHGLFLFLVARPVPGVGYTFRLRRADVLRALAAFAAYAAVALPAGLATHFLAWHPRLAPAALAAPVAIYLMTGVPEEFLFRGIIQNTLTRLLGPRGGLALGAVVFGLAHLPDPRYAALAAVAGVAYGWVYQRTGRITASAITHAAVDATWVILLRR